MTPRHRAATADGGDRDGGCGRRDGRHEGTEEEAPLELAAAVAIALARWRIHSAGGSLDASLDASLDVPAGTLAGDVMASVAPVAFLLFRRLVAGGVAASTRWWLWPHAFLREFVGLVAAEGVPMPVAFAIIVITYGAAERATLLGQVT